ncbi:FUSC family protein [Christiangramia fulva]|uniref:FUSC family protein n=2 Tax=Christiangramia fulva TaxID=2126553 RepID=A0A2R3ZB06_9FLAO|nr:FUSC family protein [Christiangramia fulva]
MGCLLSSPSDVTGTYKHKSLGILTGALLGGCSYVIAKYAATGLLSSLVMLFLLIFAISYLAVYGFRASLVSFAGLLAVVLSFAGLSASSIEIWQKGLLIIGGGIWYLLLSSLWHFIRPKRATEQLLSETMELTGEYLQIRVKLYRNADHSQQLSKELLQLQVELNEKHENLRELLISSRKSGGNSGYARKRLLVFIDLVDILELAMAHPLDYEKMHELFKNDEAIINDFASFSEKLALQLMQIATALYRKKDLPVLELDKLLGDLENSFREFRSKIDIPERRESLLMLRHLLDYQQQQAERIINIDHVLRDIAKKPRPVMREKEAQKFLSTQEYDVKTLLSNFNFQSPFFRHSLRLSLIMIIGFLAGFYFSIQNSYWILLTIVVIMRPNYGLTKQRTRKRIIGTLIGGALAVGILFLTQNTTVYAILALVTLTLAFSLIQKNYTTAAIFITLSIVFIYALLKPDVLKVIKFRVLDTLVGAALAAAGNFFFWPKWEKQELPGNIAASLQANLEYFREISSFYQLKGKLPTSYKLSRKQAFLKIGDLNGAFQRMAQEPKAQKQQLALFYEIVSINQTFLSVLASLGTYIRTHPTTKASSAFKDYTENIIDNLETALNYLQDPSAEKSEKSFKRSPEEGLEEKYEKLVNYRNSEISQGKLDIDPKVREELQEAHLVTRQLKWLGELSVLIKKNCIKIIENK